MPLPQAVNASIADDVFLVLLTVAHPNLDPPIRVAANTEDVVSRGETFTALAFEFGFPVQDKDTAPVIVLRIDATAEIVAALHLADNAASLDVEVVLASDPDIVEVAYPDMRLQTVTFDALTVEAEVGFDDVLNLAYPGESFTPGKFPNLH